MKKIVVNALQYKKNSSGIGVLIRELFGRYTRKTMRECQVILPHDGPDFLGVSNALQFRCPWNHSQGVRRILFQSFQMGLKYCRNAALLTTDSKVPFFLPRDCEVIPLVTDLAVYRMQDVYQWSRVFLWKLQYRYLKKKAKNFLAISEFTKSEMVALMDLSPEQIHVIPCAASEEYYRTPDEKQIFELRKRYQLPDRFLLFVGNFNPRKNLERMIRAFNLAKSDGYFDCDLVIAGEQGWKFDREQALSGVQNRDAIHFIGFVPDEDMAALYSAAELFVFPTLYEGFGIPVIEAQLCGTPVLTSNCSSLPEVGGEGAFYVDPYDIQAISNGLIQMTQDESLRKELVQKGYENAKCFSWEKSASLLNDVLEEILG